MKSAYIFHDAFSNPISDWYPWMKSMLEASGYFVVVPEFPTPAGQSLQSWEVVVKNVVPKWDSETIVVGHGAGGAFALRMVEKSPERIHGLFLVASYASKIGHAGFDRVNESFFATPFDFEKIKSNAMIIETFSGENDPFVPASASEELAKNLDVENKIIQGGGHVTRADGFSQCVSVLQGIKESIGALEKSINPEPVSEPADISGQILPIDLKKQILDKKVSSEASNLKDKNVLDARTMYEDMSELVNSNSGSVASSLLSKARQDDAEKKSASPKSTKNIFYIAGTIFAIGIALCIAGYFLYQASPANVAPTDAPIASLILADSHVKIDVANQPSYAVAAEIRAALAQPVADSTIRDIVYANGNSRVSLNAVLSALGTSAPDSLSSQLDAPTFMHGEASFNNATSHFLVIQVLNYDTAFSGMRDWEPTMFRDLGIFFGASDATLKTQSSAETFTDAMIENHPVRALYDANNNLILAYFFINENTLVITDSTAIIPQLLERYADSQIYK